MNSSHEKKVNDKSSWSKRAPASKDLVLGLGLEPSGIVSIPAVYCRVAQKLAPFLCALSLPNIDRFSQLFHSENQEKICNNTITNTISSVSLHYLVKCQVYIAAFH